MVAEERVSLRRPRHIPHAYSHCCSSAAHFDTLAVVRASSSWSTRLHCRRRESRVCGNSQNCLFGRVSGPVADDGGGFARSLTPTPTTSVAFQTALKAWLFVSFQIPHAGPALTRRPPQSPPRPWSTFPPPALISMPVPPTSSTNVRRIFLSVGYPFHLLRISRTVSLS